MSIQKEGYGLSERINKIKNFRYFALKQIQYLTIEELNKIPEGYNNNIIWNLAHLICAQQSMCYVRASLSSTVSDTYFSPYLPGTKPEKLVSEAEFAVISELLISTIDQLQTDLQENLFHTYSPSAMTQKIYGVEVNNFSEAIDFLLYHEGFHSGYILALKHIV